MMTDTVHVKKFNESFLKVWSDEAGILYELNDYFSFMVDGYKFQPKFKAGIWDGRISLYNLSKKTLYCGLFSELQEFCQTRGYSIEIENSPAYGLPNEEANVSLDDAKEFVDSLNLHSRGEKLEIRDYQYSAVQIALNHKRQIILSPTGSGKSAIIYSITRYLVDDEFRVLIVVPNTTLIHQMKNDFKDYSSENGFDVESNTHIIMAGKDKKTDKMICISTWQSLMHQEPSWFNQYNAVLIDEAHQARAMELSKLMEKCTDLAYRFGFTGSLDNSKTNKMVIKGLFGPITKVTTTRKLMDDGQLSDLRIKSIVLDYSKETKSLVKKFDYQKEIDFLCQHDRRNKFIRNLALSLEGNTLILYNYIEKHGDLIHDLLKEKVGDRKLYYIHGEVEAEDRDAVRAIVENSNNAIILASVGTFSTGVNIRKLHNIIFASPTKSVIRVLQSIGRGLRLSDGKEYCTLYDIMDKLSNSKTRSNYTYNHGIERLKIFTKEQFPYKIVDVKIEE